MGKRAQDVMAFLSGVAERSHFTTEGAEVAQRLLTIPDAWGEIFRNRGNGRKPVTREHLDSLPAECGHWRAGIDDDMLPIITAHLALDEEERRAALPEWLRGVRYDQIPAALAVAGFFRFAVHTLSWEARPVAVANVRDRCERQANAAAECRAALKGDRVSDPDLRVAIERAAEYFEGIAGDERAWVERERAAGTARFIGFERAPNKPTVSLSEIAELCSKSDDAVWEAVQRLVAAEEITLPEAETDRVRINEVDSLKVARLLGRGCTAPVKSRWREMNAAATPEAKAAAVEVRVKATALAQMAKLLFGAAMPGTVATIINAGLDLKRERGLRRDQVREFLRAMDGPGSWAGVILAPRETAAAGHAGATLAESISAWARGRSPGSGEI